MKISEYISKKGISIENFAEQLQVTHGAVCHWIKGRNKPSEEMINSIYKITDGKVTPNDFYGITKD